MRSAASPTLTTQPRELGVSSPDLQVLHVEWGTLGPVETLGTRNVYANGWMSVREDTVRLPDGSTGIYAVVDAADIALVVPSDGERLHLVEQYRYPVADRCWEFPSGSADRGIDADAAAAARRELREETGLVANSLTPIGRLRVAPSMINLQCDVFLATDLSEGEPQREVAEQGMRSAWFKHAEVQQMIADGDISDTKSVAAFALLLIRSMPVE
jgi:8-oxo-dGTP pyrophosphatase MutT (NUDIX family)